MFRTDWTLNHAMNRDEGQPGSWIQRHKALGCTAAGGTGQNREVPSHKWSQHTPLRRGSPAQEGAAFYLSSAESQAAWSQGVWEHWTPACPAHRLLPSTAPRDCLSLTQASPGQAAALHYPSHWENHSPMYIKEWRKLPKLDSNCRSVFSYQRGILVFIN